MKELGYDMVRFALRFTKINLAEADSIEFGLESLPGRAGSSFNIWLIDVEGGGDAKGPLKALPSPISHLDLLRSH